MLGKKLRCPNQINKAKPLTLNTLHQIFSLKFYFLKLFFKFGTSDMENTCLENYKNLDDVCLNFILTFEETEKYNRFFFIFKNN